MLLWSLVFGTIFVYKVLRFALFDGWRLTGKPRLYQLRRPRQVLTRRQHHYSLYLIRCKGTPLLRWDN